MALTALDEVLAAVEAGLRLKITDRTDPYHHARLRREVLAALGWDRDENAPLTVVLWLSLNHHTDGAQVRRGVASAVQHRGSARLSVTAHPGGGWAFAVAPGYVDATAAIDMADRANVAGFSLWKNEPRDLQ